MSSVVGRPGTHPVLGCLDVMGEALKGVADVEAVFMTVTEKKSALLGLERHAARVAELQLRILGDADDVAMEEGMRDVRVWSAHHAQLDGVQARRRLRLAKDLHRMPAATAALRDGTADVAQVSAIARAVAELPEDLDPEVRARAEEHLVAQTGDFAPRQLQVLGRRVLEVVAPDVAEEHERRLSEDQETAAYRRTRLRTRVDTDGTTDIHARIPDHAANRLMSSPHQRKALAIRDVTCRGEGCDIPAPWCEAHHLTPWTHGGHTDLDDGVLLCSHHHRIHDHRHTHQRQPDGTIRFHRRC